MISDFNEFCSFQNCVQGLSITGLWFMSIMICVDINDLVYRRYIFLAGFTSSVTVINTGSEKPKWSISLIVVSSSYYSRV